jgi:hypothetical protein
MRRPTDYRPPMLCSAILGLGSSAVKCVVDVRPLRLAGVPPD